MTGDQNLDNRQNSVEASFDVAIARHRADYDAVREELGVMTQEVKDKLSARLREIGRKYEEDPDWFLSEEEKETRGDMDKRNQELRGRMRASWRDFQRFNDRLAKIRDIGVSDTLELFEDNAFTSNTRVEKTVLDDLLTREDMARAGVPETVTTVKAEAQLTNMVIELLGMDTMMGANETIRIQIARMVWGREIIVDKMLAQAKNEGVSVNAGQIREKISFLVYGMLEESGMDPREARMKVENISAAMATTQGRSEIIKMSTELEHEAVK